MADRDYYEILGVSRNATDDEIKKAYRKKANQYHPDRNQDKNAETKFKEINEANKILSDKEKRAVYDQYGHAAFQSGGMGESSATNGFSGDFSEDLGDIFQSFFGGGRSKNDNQRRRGSDLRYDLKLTLEEAVRGVTKEISFSALKTCDSCHGSGARPGSSQSVCPTCKGNGEVCIKQGFFTVQQTCPHCVGSGKITRDKCSKCVGKGQREKLKTLSVQVPAGIDTGDRIRLSGEGAGNGDLYVQVEVKSHPIFKRDGNDLYCDVPINFAIAALGGEIEVPTLEGRIKLKISEETQTNKSFRLRGKGVKSVRGSDKGDLFCRVVVETPVNLNEEQKQLLRSFSGTADEKNSPRSKSFLDGIKKFFDDLTH